MPNVKATKILQKRSASALESFHKYYEGIWGEDRWHDSLFPALSKATTHCALINLFADIGDITRCLQLNPDHPEQQLSSLDLTSMPCIEPVVLTDMKHFPLPDREAQAELTLSSHWFLDFASVLAARMLQVRPGESVLDLCAAPGGKSLVLAQMLFPEHRHGAVHVVTDRDKSVLHSNEIDRNRNKRLASNLKTYLPEALYADRGIISILQLDASEKTAVDDLPLGANGYNKVLLDAPCSSERHVIHAHLAAASAGQVSEEMANWKASHTKTLAKQQLALLMTALRAAKVGGNILYATCSISNEENDDVVERMFHAVKRERKKKDLTWKVQVDRRLEEQAAARDTLNRLSELTKYGRIVLPDHIAGGHSWGPLYFCLLQKVQSGARAALEKVDNEESTPA